MIIISEILLRQLSLHISLIQKKLVQLLFVKNLLYFKKNCRCHYIILLSKKNYQGDAAIITRRTLF